MCHMCEITMWRLLALRMCDVNDVEDSEEPLYNLFQYGFIHID